MPLATAVDGTQIHYQALEPARPSSLPPVVLIHGIGLSGRFWFGMPEQIANHAQHPRRVVVVDNRGTGKSGRPLGVYPVPMMAEDVRAVLDAEHVSRAVVVGISMGGMVAQELALRHPQRVGGLVLMATTAGLPHGRLPSPQALMTLLGLALPGTPSMDVVRLMISERDVARAAALMAPWPAAMREDPISPASLLSQFAGCAVHSTGFRLHTIRCPTVVIAGQEDVLMPPVNSERIAARIPGAHLELLPNVAHAIPTQDEAVVERALLRLLQLDGTIPRSSASATG